MTTPCCDYQRTDAGWWRVDSGGDLTTPILDAEVIALLDALDAATRQGEAKDRQIAALMLVQAARLAAGGVVS